MYLAISIVVFKLQKQPFNLVLDPNLIFLHLFIDQDSTFSSTTTTTKEQLGNI